MATTLVKVRCLQRKLYSRSKQGLIVVKGNAGIWHKTPGGNLSPACGSDIFVKGVNEG